jgi:serine/threonine-protein kinase
MGRLYVAEQMGIEGFSKIVALKLILPHLADSPHFRDMFLNEARVAARLEHPNIVATHELGEVDGTYFISMEYLSGEDLAAILVRCQSSGPMPLEIAAALAQQSANGLHYAHELRDSGGRRVELVHRDVSPLNIFVTYYGMVKLLDFGIVKGGTETPRTMPGVFKGKYAYCAPEQIEGGTVDRRTDVFCLGIVLWECLTGRSLFNRTTDVATIDAVRGEEIEPPSAFRAEVPHELDEIVLRALARDRKDRFQTGHALSEALDRFLLQRENRPTSKSIGGWLESLFGRERATVKKAIAQGSEVETDLSWPEVDPNRPVTHESTGNGKGRSVGQARPGWPNSPGDRGGEPVRNPNASSAPRPHPASLLGANASGSLGAAPHGIRSPASLHGGLAESFGPAAAAGPASAKPGRRTWTMLAALGALAVAIFVGVSIRAEFRATAPEGLPAKSSMGALDIRSEPSGAQIFADGDPTGLTTPAVLTGLRPGRSVEIRVDKVGYTPITQGMDVRPGTQLRSFRLVAAAGTVRIEALPSTATVYVDDGLVDAQAPLVLSLGQHRLRVESSTGVLMSRTIDVHPGEQSVRVGGKLEEQGR